MFEANFGVLVNMREDNEPQFKMFSEGIKFKNDPTLVAKPSRVPSDSNVLYWKVYDESDNELAEITFTSLSGIQDNFIVENNERKALERMVYYSAKVKSHQEVFIR